MKFNSWLITRPGSNLHATHTRISFPLWLSLLISLLPNVILQLDQRLRFTDAFHLKSSAMMDPTTSAYIYLHCSCMYILWFFKFEKSYYSVISMASDDEDERLAHFLEFEVFSELSDQVYTYFRFSRFLLMYVNLDIYVFYLGLFRCLL